MPPVPGVDKKGVFVYRTIEDLERIIAYAEHVETSGGHRRRPARPGGGQGGLRPRPGNARRRVRPAADAAANRRSRLRVLVGKINALGVQVHLNKNTKEILGNGKVEGMAFADGGQLDVKMVVVSAGIKPRDELARACGLTVGQRGGVVVDDHLRTSDPGHLRHRRGRPAPAA